MASDHLEARAEDGGEDGVYRLKCVFNAGIHTVFFCTAPTSVFVFVFGVTMFCSEVPMALGGSDEWPLPSAVI